MHSDVLEIKTGLREKSEPSDIAGPRLIELHELSFRYYGSEKKVLDGITLGITKGEVVVIAGKSGSGKSTLLRAINGLIPHQHGGEYSGSVEVDGLSVASTKMSELASRVGYIFQNPENQIFMFSVERDVAFGLENLSFPRDTMRKKVNWAMGELGVRELAMRAPHELSDGQKQRVAIAGSIVMGQRILILDEPTSLLDPYTARSVIELVKKLHDELGITILIVEHRLDLVSRIASRLIILDGGKVVFDGPCRKGMFESNIQYYGVTVPTIVKTAKILGPDLLARHPEPYPVSPTELVRQILDAKKQSHIDGA